MSVIVFSFHEICLWITRNLGRAAAANSVEYLVMILYMSNQKDLTVEFRPCYNPCAHHLQDDFKLLSNWQCHDYQNALESGKEQSAVCLMILILIRIYAVFVVFCTTFDAERKSSMHDLYASEQAAAESFMNCVHCLFFSFRSRFCKRRFLSLLLFRYDYCLLSY